MNDNLNKLIEMIEEDLKTANMLNQFQLGLALKVIEDRLWNIDAKLAQKCNNLQYDLLNRNI